MVDGLRISGTGPVERATRILPSIERAPSAPAARPEPSTIETLAAQGASVDTARVAAIRAAIADGSYTVDADAIAAKMIEADLPPA
jgi:negative regulator of flagellin synthesis FlgM